MTKLYLYRKKLTTQLSNFKAEKYTDIRKLFFSRVLVQFIRIHLRVTFMTDVELKLHALKKKKHQPHFLMKRHPQIPQTLQYFIINDPPSRFVPLIFDIIPQLIRLFRERKIQL